MIRVLTVVVVGFSLCAAPAHGQGASARGKTDTSAKAAAAKAGAGAAQGAARGAKPVEAAAPQTRGGAQGDGRQMTIEREVFSYTGAGRRDPAVSLMNTDDLRPLISEVQVIGIMYDEEGTNSIAILRNTVDKKTQYRLKLGQMLGRMKVTQITRREVVFTIDEFGFSRQERLSVKPDTTVARTP